MIGRRRLFCFALAVVFCSSCDSDRIGPSAPAEPGRSQPGSPPPPSTVAVRVEGRVVDAERWESIPRAVVSTTSVCYPGRCATVEQPTSATADDNGIFVLTANIPENWSQLQLRSAGVGYEPGQSFVTPSSVAAAELRIAPDVDDPARRID